jgi:hypothetical protein
MTIAWTQTDNLAPCPTPTFTPTHVPVAGNGLTVLNNMFKPRKGETAEIRYYLPEAGRVTLSVFDMVGERVAVLWDGLEEKGDHSVNWDGKNRNGLPVASGLYLAVLSTPQGDTMKKVGVVK